MIKNIFKMKCPNCKSVFVDEATIYECKFDKCPNCECSVKVSDLYGFGYIFIIFFGAFLGGSIGDKFIDGNTGLEKFISALIVGGTIGFLLFIYTLLYPKKLYINNKDSREGKH